MRLDDINAFIDVKRVYDRAFNRAFGSAAEEGIQLSTMNEFREVATITDSSIKRTPIGDSGSAIFRIQYRNVEFWYMSSAGEVS